MQNRSRIVELVAAVACGLAMSVATLAAVAAQPATPAGTPDIPAASECTIEALEPMDLLGLVQGGSTDRDLLDATPVVESSLPDGPPATDEELDGISENVRQLVACANARDPLRLVALLTDDFKVALAGAALGLQGEDPEELTARFPVPITMDDVEDVDQLGMIPIRDARLLRDGRVAAILEPLVDGIDQTVGFFVTFELVGEQWLIDDVTILAPNASGTPGARVVRS